MSDSEIIEALATKVMGWAAVIGPLQARGETVPRYWSTGRNLLRMKAWNPFEKPEHSKQVRMKLAERYTVWELGKSSTPRIFTFYVDGGADDGHYAEADTEERAVALCALKAVGINVE